MVPMYHSTHGIGKSVRLADSTSNGDGAWTVVGYSAALICCTIVSQGWDMSNGRTGFYLLVALALTASLPAEDVKLREQAVQLLELANAVSLPGALKGYKQAVKFRIHELDGTVKEGTFTRVSAGASGFREEATFGDYHGVIVISGDRTSSEATRNRPPAVSDLRAELPVHLGRFDQDDVIRAIEDAQVLGRPARCIQFRTRFGDTVQSNQICVDMERGALLRWQVGDEVFENSDYFKVGRLWEPGQIRRYRRGQLNLEIEQHLELVEGQVDSQALLPPTGDWHRLYPCKNPRRAVGISTPMPPPGTAGKDIIEVVVHGWIWNDGSVRLTEIASSPRPDLNAEALKVVSTWTFLPLMCNDREATTDADLVVHFQGR